MLAKLRNRQLALGAAFLFITLASIDTTYAHIPDEQIISLDDSHETSAALTVASEARVDLSATTVATLELSGLSAVDPKAIALVALSARQIELAKTPKGARQIASAIIKEKYSKWGARQVACLDRLWTGESHWNFQAHNYRSGAHGIPQALPATKMEIVATDWRTNPITQIKWGLSYIKARYETPCNALWKKQRHNYY